MVLIGIGTSLKQKLALKQTLYSFALKIRSGIGLLTTRLGVDWQLIIEIFTLIYANHRLAAIWLQLFLSNRKPHGFSRRHIDIEQISH